MRIKNATPQITVILMIFFVAFLYTIPSTAQNNLTRKVIIDDITINGIAQNPPYDRVVIGDKDSLEISYKLEIDKNTIRDAYLYKITLVTGRDSSVTNVGLTEITYNNLSEGVYYFRVTANDLQRRWTASGISVKIVVDNEKAALIHENKTLKSDIKQLDSIIKSRPEVPQTQSGENRAISNGNFLYGLIFGILFVAILAGIYFIAFRKKNKSVAVNKTVVEDIMEMKKVNPTPESAENNDEFEKLKIENSNLRAELASLRGQIDAMQSRSEQLTQKNRDLQSSISKLSSSKDELEELQRQKDELFAVLIHDIKNPVSLIKSLVELLTSYDLTANEQQEIIQDIAQTTSKIVSLSHEVSRILALEGNRLSLSFEKTDINEIASDVMHRNMVAANRKQIKLVNELNENIPLAEVDSQKIDEIFDNLLSNAIKFTQQSGTVRVRTYKEDKRIVVEIADNGIGLTEEDLKHAFQRGARLSAKPTGGESSTGLGLWIVKKLIEAHNGRVWVKSVLGKGSTFAFAVPIEQAD